MFTRQHYKAIGCIIAKSFADTPNNSTEIHDIYSTLVTNIIDYFKQDNPRFDRTRFLYFIETERRKSSFKVVN